MSQRSARGIPALRGSAGLLAATVALALLAAARSGWAQPVESTLEFQSPPPDFTYGVGAPIALVLKVRTTTPSDVLTAEGFGGQEYWRRLYFQDFLGRTIVNAAEATIHAEGRLFQCLSRSGVLQLVSIPVVPVEVLAGTASGSGFYREYAVPDATKLFDLSQPGRYSVKARIPLQTFAAGGDDVIPDCDQFAGQTVLNVGAGTGATGFLVESNTLEFVVVNTPVGSGVTVQPPDPATGGSPVTVTFTAVTQAGATTLTTSGGSGPAPPPATFSLGSPPVFYDLTTTAAYTPPATVCIHYGEPSFGNEAALRLFHFEGGAWLDVTTSLDTVGNVICGAVVSLSPFAPFQLTNAPPVASAGPDQSVVIGALVTLDGSGSSDPDHQPGPLTYQWTQVSGPSVTLASPTSVHPTFTASAVGTDVLQLTVDDGSGQTTLDTVAVTVRYGFTGFSDPAAGQSFKTGGPTVKVRFQLFNAAGQAIGPVTPAPQLQFIKQGAGSATVTGAFTFDPKKKVFGFDISTKGPGFSAGMWDIRVILGDGTTRTVTIQLK